jgi:hypothetical protein
VVSQIRVSGSFQIKIIWDAPRDVLLVGAMDFAISLLEDSRSLAEKLYSHAKDADSLHLFFFLRGSGDFHLSEKVQEVMGDTSADLLGIAPPGSQLRRPGSVEYIVILFHALKTEFFPTGD